MTFTMLELQWQNAGMLDRPFLFPIRRQTVELFDIGGVQFFSTSKRSIEVARNTGRSNGLGNGHDALRDCRCRAKDQQTLRRRG